MVPFEHGHGWEYLLPHRRAALGAEPDDDFPILLRRAFAFGTSPNGVQGFKVVWSHFGPLYSRYARQSSAAEGDEPEELLSREIRWVYLERRDRLAQAVSWARATQSGRWNVLVPGSAGGAEQYNYLLIRYKLWSIEAERRAWRRFFDDLGVQPLNLVYEDFIAAPLETLTLIGEFLGLRGPLTLHSAETRIRKQRDRVNQRWRERFLQDDSGWLNRITASLATPFRRSSWAAVRRGLRPGPRG
jgi:LPS sulfotransferase NodH